MTKPSPLQQTPVAWSVAPYSDTRDTGKVRVGGGWAPLRLAAIPLALVLALFLLVSAQGQEAAPGWSEPVNISHSDTQSDYPSLVVDPAGGLHVIWTEWSGIDQDQVIFYSHLGEEGWSEPLDVLMTPGGGPAFDAIMAADYLGYLHVVWRGAGTMFYSSAYAPAAGSANHWSEPQAIAPFDIGGSSPHLVVDRASNLHLVYAQPLGNASGIYYMVRSEGSGSWQAPVAVYTNPRADRMVVKPRLAIGPDGTLYVVWVATAYPNTFPPLGIQCASSTDGGETWSRPLLLADGPYDDPGIIVRGQKEVHVVWSGTAGDRYKFHRWSRDGLHEWSPIWRDTDLGGIQGWPALLLDSGGTLHWLMVGTIFSTQNDSLYYTTWAGKEWSPGVVVLPGIATTGQNPAFVSAAVVRGNELHLVLQYPLDTTRNTWQNEIFYLHRTLDNRPAWTVQPALPSPTVAVPTATPTVPPLETATPVTTRAPRAPTASGALVPPPQDNTTSLLLVSAVPAAGLVLLVIVVYLLRQGRRTHGR